MYGEVSRSAGGDKKLENGAGRVAPTAFLQIETERTIPQSAALTAPFAQGSQGVDGGQQ